MKYVVNLFLLIVFVFLESIYPQDNWFWQNPLPQGNHIRKIISIDENTVVAGGLNGVFLKSTNKGGDWEISYLGENSLMVTSLRYFPSDNSLLALVLSFSFGTTLYKSDDNGLTWDSIFTFTNIGIGDIDKNSENVLYAVGSFGKIYKSYDNGYNWDTIPSVTNESLLAINFYDNQNGFIVGRDGTILKSSDNGNTWSNIQSGILEDLLSLDFIDSMNGITVGQDNSILKTTDGGINWVVKAVQLINPNGQLLDVQFIDSVNIIAVGGSDDFFGGENPTVIRSSDGGENWIEISSQFQRGISSLSFIDTNNGLCAGFSGGIYKTENAGSDWSKITTGTLPDFYDLCSIDSLEFYATGSDHVSFTNILLYTNNGGINWYQKNIPNFLNVRGIDFINSEYGIIVGDTLIYYTSDGGNIWNPSYVSATTYLKDVIFIDDNKVLAIGGEGKILKSSDAGKSWFPINSGVTGDLEIIVFKDSLNGLIIVNFGLLIKTTDGGETWQPINYNFSGLNDGVFFGNNGIALAGQSGDIFISTDDGTSWTIRTVSSPDYLSSIDFRDPLNGTAVGEIGKIFYTTDGGDNWISEFSPTIIDLIKIKYSSNNTAIILGKEGVILGSNPGIMVSIDEERIIMFTNFILKQNYPNPFNPTTNFEFRIADFGMVSLKVYDVLGNEIATIVNEELPAGIYKYQWNASGVSSGVFFYRLQVKGFVETKKLILIK
ncbi:MAG: YCF48-related protein [Ignavibacteria bacterium]|nr:YCF48-related protein [Ignavibacteria bacterium]